MPLETGTGPELPGHATARRWSGPCECRWTRPALTLDRQAARHGFGDAEASAESDGIGKRAEKSDTGGDITLPEHDRGARDRRRDGGPLALERHEIVRRRLERRQH